MEKLNSILTSPFFIKRFLANLFWGFLILVLIINFSIAGRSTLKRGPEVVLAQEEDISASDPPVMAVDQPQQSTDQPQNQSFMMNNSNTSSQPENTEVINPALDQPTQQLSSQSDPVTVVRRFPECAGTGPGMVHDVEQLSDGSFRTFNEHFQTGVCGDPGTVRPEDRIIRTFSECAGTGPGRVHNVEELSNGGFRTFNEHFQAGVCGDTSQQTLQPTPQPTTIIQRVIERPVSEIERISSSSKATGGNARINITPNPQVIITPTSTPTPTPTATPILIQISNPATQQTRFISTTVASTPTPSPTVIVTPVQTNNPQGTTVTLAPQPVLNVSQTQNQSQTQTQNNHQTINNTNTASTGSTEPVRVIVTSAGSTTTTPQVIQVPVVEQKKPVAVVITQSTPSAETKELPKTGLPLAGVGLASLLPIGLRLRKAGIKSSPDSLNPNSMWIDRQIKL